MPASVRISIYEHRRDKNKGSNVGHEVDNSRKVSSLSVRELNNVLNDYPDIVSKLEKMGEEARYDLGDNLTNVKGVGTREVGKITP